MAQRAEGHLLGLSSRAAGSSITLVEPELRACYAPPGTEWVSHHQSSSILVCAPLSILTLGPGILLMLWAAPRSFLSPVFWYFYPKGLGSWREEVVGLQHPSAAHSGHPLFLQITSDHQRYWNLATEEPSQASCLPAPPLCEINVTARAHDC